MQQRKREIDACCYGIAASVTTTRSKAAKEEKGRNAECSGIGTKNIIKRLTFNKMNILY